MARVFLDTPARVILTNLHLEHLEEVSSLVCKGDASQIELRVHSNPTSQTHGSELCVS